MTLFHRLRIWLLVVGLVHLAVPVGAAELDRKYLLDDAHLVVTVNIQKALASPAYQKHFQAQVEALLKADVAQTVVKDLGFDPLKDIDRITLVMGLSCYRDDPQMENGQIVGFDSQAGPYFIVQGRFDAAKLEAKAKQLVPNLKAHEIGANKVYELNSNNLLGAMPMFAAVVDPKTVVIARFKEQVAVALDKAAGKKKTTITDKVMAVLLDKLDADQVLTAVASGEMIGGSSSSISNNNGQVIATVKHRTLKEEVAVDSVRVVLSLADDVKGEVTITVNDADQAKEMAGKIEQGVQAGIDQIKVLIESPKQRIQPKHLAPWLNVLKTVTVKAKDNQIVLQGNGTAETAVNLVQSYFSLRSPAPPPPIPDDNE